MCPKVSVIIPVYNVSLYIERCFRSISNQTYSNIEIIFIDDGSDDGSGKLCDTFVKEDVRCKVVHKKNEGVSVARNVGLQMAQGEYILFVDADDYIDTTLIKKIVPLMQELDVIIFGYYICNTADEIIGKSCYEGLLKAGFIWNKMYRKKSIENITFDTRMKLFEDEKFNNDVLKKNIKVRIIAEEYLYRYILRENSAVSTLKIDSEFQIKKMYEWKMENIRLLEKGENANRLIEQVKAESVVETIKYIVTNEKISIKDKKIRLEGLRKEINENPVKAKQMNRKNKLVLTLLEKRRYGMVLLIYYLRGRSVR